MPTKCFTKATKTGKKYTACVDTKTFKKKGVKGDAKSKKPTAKGVMVVRKKRKIKQRYKTKRLTEMAKKSTIKAPLTKSKPKPKMPSVSRLEKWGEKLGKGILRYKGENNWTTLYNNYVADAFTKSGREKQTNRVEQVNKLKKTLIARVKAGKLKIPTNRGDGGINDALKEELYALHSGRPRIVNGRRRKPLPLRQDFIESAKFPPEPRRALTDRSWS